MSTKSSFVFDFTPEGEAMILIDDDDNVPFIGEFIDSVNEGLITEPGRYEVEVAQVNDNFEFIVQPK